MSDLEEVTQKTFLFVTNNPLITLKDLPDYFLYEWYDDSDSKEVSEDKTEYFTLIYLICMVRKTGKTTINFTEEEITEAYYKFQAVLSLEVSRRVGSINFDTFPLFDMDKYPEKILTTFK